MDQESKFKQLKFVFGVLLSILLVFMVFWLSADIQNKIKESRYIGKSEEMQSVINVSGVGEVYAKPDLATANFSVFTEGNQVAAAMEETTEKMNSIISLLKEKGVLEKDLRTTEFSINPRYAWPRGGAQVLSGYEVRQTLEVKIRDLEKSGEIVQTAVNAGANQVGNLQFTVDDRDSYVSEARKQAIDEAQAQAKEIASQLGVRLTRITGFYESTNSGYPMPYYRGGSAESFDLAVSSTPQIETGESKIEVNVSITYEIH